MGKIFFLIIEYCKNTKCENGCPFFTDNGSCYWNDNNIPETWDYKKIETAIERILKNGN